MKKHYLLTITLFLSLFFALFSCSKDDSEDYTEIPASPVIVDLNAVPYPKLSDYKFYQGEMKNLEPALGVLPYDLNSSLFTDYAKKKRFVWMPNDVSASYVSDSEILDFPAGAVLLKNFYYNNVLPENKTVIIETRLMIKKADGWIFANYIWNDEQTEATLDTEGSRKSISWQEGSEIKSTNYKIPSNNDCFTCHKTYADRIPIGTKPQNLNKLYSYADGIKNQLQKWKEAGYLDNSLPSDIVTTVDWTDTSKPLELRARSYIDINCAHCHTEGAHCDYMSMRFAFHETTNPANLGICVTPFEFINNQSHIINAGHPESSALYYRMNTNLGSLMMPLTGRSIIHTEGVELMQEWISSMEESCP